MPQAGRWATREPAGGLGKTRTRRTGFSPRSRFGSPAAPRTEGAPQRLAAMMASATAGSQPTVMRMISMVSRSTYMFIGVRVES